MPWRGSCGNRRASTHLYCTPGNGGIADEAECLPGDVRDIPRWWHSRKS